MPPFVKACLRASLLKIIIVLAALTLLLHRDAPRSLSPSNAYWLWAGISAKDAPSNAVYYVYQGRIDYQQRTTRYQHMGLYPYPLQTKKIFLVYRLHGKWPEIATIKDVFLSAAQHWQWHAVSVAGIQLDVDVATKGLLDYSDFLRAFRQQLPAHYHLSITGLADWVETGDKTALQAIATSVDDIVFQLYHHRHTLAGIDRYVHALQHYSAPFRIGLLYHEPKAKSIATLIKNPAFHGVIYFIQKRRPEIRR